MPPPSPPLLTLALAAVVSLAACGGSEANPNTPAGDSSAAPAEGAGTSAPAASATAAAEAAGPDVVTTCDKKGDLCLPPPRFVKKMCGNVNPDLALVYFKKGSPFSRAYLTGNTDAWNASGGASSQDKLVFDEEVIVLTVRDSSASGGIQVSGAGTGYDVLRWDGSCASLSGGELTFKTPPKAKAAKLEWKAYSDDAQNALLKDATIAKINKTRRDECKGVTMGDVSKPCQTAVEKLSDAIIVFIREGGEVPTPKALK